MSSVAALLLAGRAPGKGPTEIDTGWVAKGNTEGAAIVAKYQALLGQLDETCEIRAETEDRHGSRASTTRSVRLGDNTIIETTMSYTDPVKQPSSMLKCDNADYYFTLSKKSPTAPFALAEYGKGVRKLPLWKQASGLHGETFYHLKFAIEALDPAKRTSLRAVRFDPKTALLSIQYESSTGRARFKESVLIDPGKSWSVKQQRTETPYFFITTDYVYGTVIDGLHLPGGSMSSSIPKPGQPADLQPSRYTHRVLDIKRTQQSPDDFRLSAFGLPEPVDVSPRPRPTPWYYWLLGAAGGCGALSLGFAYLRRRLEARRAANTALRDGKS